MQINHFFVWAAARKILMALSYTLCFVVAVAVSSSTANAVKVTVCASGCTYTGLQAALDATVSNEAIDVIELAAGEVFPGEYRFPARSSEHAIWIRSSRWEELPKEGTRVREEHASLMPRLSSIASIYPIVQFGWDEIVIEEERPETDQVRIGYGSFWPLIGEGTKISLRRGDKNQFEKLPLPAPLQSNIVYHLRNCTNTFPKYCQLSETPNGPIIDITGIADHSGYSQHPRGALVNNPKHWRLTGIEISPNPAHNKTTAVQIGGLEPMSFVEDIWLDRVIIRGDPVTNGPRIGLIVHGSHIQITDSWIGHIKSFLNESKCISLGSSPGPVSIINNYCGAASIGILTGGQGLVPENQLAKNIVIQGNHIEKMAYMHYLEGDLPPTGACYYANNYGAFYRDRTKATTTCANGGCYECTRNREWAETLTAPFRNMHYLTKGGVEFKNCDTCEVSGNVIEGTFAGFTNTDFCFSLVQTEQGGYAVKNTNIRFTNNWCKNVFDGLALTAAPSPWAEQSNWKIDNILITGQQRALQVNMFAGPEEYLQMGLLFFTRVKGLHVSRITQRPAPVPLNETSAFFPISFEGSLLNGTFPSDGFIRNSIFGATYSRGGILASENFNSCNMAGLGAFINNLNDNSVSTNSARQWEKLSHLVMFGPSANFGSANCWGPKATVPTDDAMGFAGTDTDELENNRLTSQSPFSVSNPNATLLAHDFDAPNSNTEAPAGDIGVDIDELKQFVIPAIEGKRNWLEQSEVMIQAGTTNAIIEYRAERGQSCAITLYNSKARIPANQHPDTNTAQTQAEERPGNVASAMDTHRQFGLGTVAALTAGTTYFYELTCGSRKMVGQFSTKTESADRPTGSLELTMPQAERSLEVKGVVEYANNADFTDSTLSAEVELTAAKQKVSFQGPTGKLIYARWVTMTADHNVLRRGPTKLLIAP